MLQTREIVTVAGTLACAIGIGFVMQSGETAQDRYGSDAKMQTARIVPVAAPYAANPNTQGAHSADVVLDVQSITLTSAQIAPPKLTSEKSVALSTGARTIAAPQLVEPQREAEVVAPQLACDITATAIATKGAMLSVSLSAPCLPLERVTLHHNGLMFTQTTGRSGTLQTSLPALAENAVVIFAFSNGEGAVAEAVVADLGNYDRSALQWKGETGFELHAREFGADYGDEGHVWAGARRGENAIDDGVGFLTQLGDTTAIGALMAQVYTFPRSMGAQEGRIDLSVEAEVTLMNCGLEIEAQSLELKSGAIKTQDLTLAVPDCGAKGSFLVLNNLIQDLRVASN